jgi:hypothetical protein
VIVSAGTCWRTWRRGTFVAKAENEIPLGPPGLGKTNLGIGLGVKATHTGHLVVFDTANNWITRLAEAVSPSRTPRGRAEAASRLQLIIIDEVGYIPSTSIRGRFPLLGLVWVDGGYVNSVDAKLVDWARDHENLEIVAVPRNADVKGFQVLPRRWVVERTFGWITRCRRLARDYERKTAHAEAMIQFAMIRLMAARLAGEELAPPTSPVEIEAARRLAEDLKD